VQAILDAPVAAIVRQEGTCRRPLGRQARDGVGYLPRFAALLFRDALNTANLLQAGPVEMSRQARTGLEMALRNPTMPFACRAMLGEVLLPLAFATGGKSPAETRLRWPLSARVGCL
jgi:hypothetical protein